MVGPGSKFTRKRGIRAVGRSLTARSRVGPPKGNGGPNTPASTKVRAADSVLNHGAKAMEIEDIEVRVAALERNDEVLSAGFINSKTELRKSRKRRSFWRCGSWASMDQLQAR